MEFQEGARSDWSHYFCSQSSTGYENGSARLESNSDPDPYCSILTDREPARVRTCNNRSFAMDARMRLDSLKSGYGSPLPGWGTARLVESYSDAWDSEDSQDEESALDSVELLDVEDNVQDEENWLYQTPEKQDQDQASDERSKSVLGWCRHVLDHPSPEIEAACRSLINRLDQSSNKPFYKHPEVFHLTGNVSVDSSMDQTSASMTHNTSDSTDGTEQSLPGVSISSSYKLQDITDIHILARLQEASLRQDYDCTPASASKRGAEPSYFSTTIDRAVDFKAGSKSEGSSSPCWQPRLSTLSSSPSPSAITKLGCQSPKVSRLHQQVTQFKLLRRAQNEGASPVRTRSPLRTSLRSLQAVRNSRSLETDDYQPADAHISHPQISGTSSVSYWSPSHSTAHIQSTGATQTARDCSTEQTLAVKRLQRSQSASPCRIPHPAKGRLSLHGRVFASPERSSAVAWARR